MEEKSAVSYIICNMCEWEGTEEQLVPYKDEMMEDVICYGCPNCKLDDYLMDK